MRTSESVSPIALPGIATSMIAFVIVYFVVFGAGVVILLRMMAQEPERGEPGLSEHEPIRTAGINPGPAQGPGKRVLDHLGAPGQHPSAAE